MIIAVKDRNLTREEIISILRQEKRSYYVQNSYYILADKLTFDAEGKQVDEAEN